MADTLETLRSIVQWLDRQDSPRHKTTSHAEKLGLRVSRLNPGQVLDVTNVDVDTGRGAKIIREAELPAAIHRHPLHVNVISRKVDCAAFELLSPQP